MATFKECDFWRVQCCIWRHFSCRMSGCATGAGAKCAKLPTLFDWLKWCLSQMISFGRGRCNAPGGFRCSAMCAKRNTLWECHIIWQAQYLAMFRQVSNGILRGTRIWSTGNSSRVQDQLRNVQNNYAACICFAAALADGTVVTWEDLKYSCMLSFSHSFHSFFYSFFYSVILSFIDSFSHSLHSLHSFFTSFLPSFHPSLRLSFVDFFLAKFQHITIPKKVIFVLVVTSFPNLPVPFHPFPATIW